MKMEEIKSIGDLHSIKVSKLKKADLVRAVQKAELNEQCFEAGKLATCGQVGCSWRDICS